MAANTNIEKVSLCEAFRDCAARYPECDAVVFQDRHTTFRMLDKASDTLAACLAAHGIAKGDRVALYCVNSDFFPTAYLGIVKAGAVVVPVNLLLNPKEVAYILKDAGVKGIIYFELFAPAVEAVRPSLGELVVRIRIGKGPCAEGELSWQEALGTSAAPPHMEFNTGEDLAAILYTAGTTGYPKGAMLTHRNLVSNAWSVNEALPLTPGRDNVLVVLPMFHAFAATAGMLFPLLHGMTIVPLPRFEPVEVAETIEKGSIALFLGVPSMYNVLLRLPEEYTRKLSSVKYCVSGGAAMPQEVMKAFEKRFGTLIYEGDGPTECSPVTCVNPVGGRRKPASVGLPVPLVEMCIMDDLGKECPRNQMGELCVRGPNVMKGYWNRPDDTAEAFFGEWFRTGDLGTEDEDGYFYIVDRKKDMIIVNGMNVYPRIIEELLYQHPAVREAAVVGEPHKLHGEIPSAYVSLKEGHELSSRDLREYCRESLGRHEVPRKVFFLDELPKNAAGKILKRELRKDGEIERGVDSRTEE